MKIVARNKKAFHDYHINDKIEAGLVLTGDEVKSLRAGEVSLVGAFATFRGVEMFLINCHITPYAKAFGFALKQHDPTQSRKLLLHKKQLSKLIGEVAQKGVTVIPLSIYFNERGRAKVELGVATHKKAAGKKEALKERDIARETRRELRGKY